MLWRRVPAVGHRGFLLRLLQLKHGGSNPHTSNNPLRSYRPKGDSHEYRTVVLWGILLVGREGVRLKEFVHKCDGTDVPRQFSASTGSAHRHVAVPW